MCSVLCMSVDNHAIVFTGRIMKFIINNRSSNKFNLKRPSGTVPSTGTATLVDQVGSHDDDHKFTVISIGPEDSIGY